MWEDTSKSYILSPTRTILQYFIRRWAANVLVYPRGDWYRQVKVENIPDLLGEIMRDDWAAHAPSNDHWAGRMGLSSLEQKARIQTDFTAFTKSQ